MRKTPDTILAMDPGLRELGYAILCGRRLVTSGVLSLRHLPQDQRMQAIRRLVRSLLRIHRARGIVVERTYRNSVPWLDRVHKVGTYARRLAGRRHLSFTTYAPQQVRKAIMGNGWAKKREVAAIIAAGYPGLRVYITQDRKWKERYWQNMFDAIALGLHHQLVTKPPSRGR